MKAQRTVTPTVPTNETIDHDILIIRIETETQVIWQLSLTYGCAANENLPEYESKGLCKTRGNI